jgi:glycosyltransferase involved in cell wall biosynthesis
MVFRTDTTFQSVEEVGGIYGGYGRLALKFQMWMESRAINKSVKILVPGQWTRDQIIEKYAVDSNKIFTYIEPSGLPLNVIPSLPIQKESLTTPLKLLLVGRNYYGKGVDVAIQIVKQLNLRGIPADMIICGCSGESTEHVKFVGTYRKSVPKELHEYVSLYQWAQLLIHPTRYESSGVVPAEAAAFSVPTITNNAGGVSSVVQDGVTGIVLPYDSPAESYVEQIISLLNTPQMYLALCSGARSAYDNEQNWSVVGKRVSELLRQIIVKSKD